MSETLFLLLYSRSSWQSPTAEQQDTFCSRARKTIVWKFGHETNRDLSQKCNVRININIDIDINILNIKWQLYRKLYSCHQPTKAQHMKPKHQLYIKIEIPEELSRLLHLTQFRRQIARRSYFNQSHARSHTVACTSPKSSTPSSFSVGSANTRVIENARISIRAAFIVTCSNGCAKIPRCNKISKTPRRTITQDKFPLPILVVVIPRHSFVRRMAASGDDAKFLPTQIAAGHLHQLHRRHHDRFVQVENVRMCPSWPTSSERSPPIRTLLSLSPNMNPRNLKSFLGRQQISSLSSSLQVQVKAQVQNQSQPFLKFWDYLDDSNPHSTS